MKINDSRNVSESKGKSVWISQPIRSKVVLNIGNYSFLQKELPNHDIVALRKENCNENYNYVDRLHTQECDI